MNTHANHCAAIALLSSNELTGGLRAGYFEPEGWGRACAMFNRDIGALDAPSRIANGSMEAFEAGTTTLSDLTFSYRA